MSDYINCKELILIECAICKENYQLNFNQYFYGVRCSCKLTSKGERQIKLFLDSCKIAYKTQVTFKECKHINPLKFDFYLPQYDLLIEFDGGQH